MRSKERTGDIEIGLAYVIRNLRIKNELSQKSLAAKAGFSVSYMYCLELGTRSVGVGIIAKLADAFGISMSDLLKLAEEQVKKLTENKGE